MRPYEQSQGRPLVLLGGSRERPLLKHKETLVFVNVRIDLPCMSVAFVATLVLGIVLVMSPSAQEAILQEGAWLLPAAAFLLTAVRHRERGQR